jgi:hypothetical protein
VKEGSSLRSWTWGTRARSSQLPPGIIMTFGWGGGWTRGMPRKYLIGSRGRRQSDSLVPPSAPVKTPQCSPTPSGVPLLPEHARPQLLSEGDLIDCHLFQHLVTLPDSWEKKSK